MLVVDKLVPSLVDGVVVVPVVIVVADELELTAVVLDDVIELVDVFVAVSIVLGGVTLDVSVVGAAPKPPLDSQAVSERRPSNTLEKCG